MPRGEGNEVLHSGLDVHACIKMDDHVRIVPPVVMLSVHETPENVDQRPSTPERRYKSKINA